MAPTQMATATLDGAGPAVYTEGRRHLFIVADDFGYCSERDRGIIEGFASGGISAATLLVNGAHASHGAAAAVAVGLPLGLHFNVRGPPSLFSPSTSSSSLVLLLHFCTTSRLVPPHNLV